MIPFSSDEESTESDDSYDSGDVWTPFSSDEESTESDSYDNDDHFRNVMLAKKELSQLDYW